MSDTAHPIHRIVTEFTSSPWAILPDKLAAMRALLELRATGQRLSEDEIRAAIATRPALPPVRHARAGVALLPLFGVLGQRMNQVLAISGGTSTEIFGAEFGQLIADDSVSAIVIVGDSPGGSCHGTDELATKIRANRGRKPIIFMVDSLAASACFWIGAQADRIVCTPGGDVGSIGVITAHEDMSGAQDKLGVKTTLITAGKHKAEGHPFAPLTDDARANLQRRVDECYARFVAAVAAGRGVPESSVREGYGQGRLLGARDALACGMVDEIATLDEVLADVAARFGGTPSRQSTRGTRQDRTHAIARQEPALDDWQRKVALDLRLLDL